MRLRSLINDDVERFCSVVKDSSSIKGIKWDDIVLRFEWTYEADYIREYLQSDESKSLKQYHKDAIIKVFKTH